MMANSKMKSELREWIESILIALILAAFIRTYFVQPFKIPSGSMRETLIEGDRIFVNKLRYGPKALPEFLAVRFREQVHVPEWLAKTRFPGLSKPKRGDIIVFVFPEMVNGCIDDDAFHPAH